MKGIVNHSIVSKVFFLLVSIGLFYTCSNNIKEIQGHIKGLDDPQTISFEAKKGDKLKATLTTPTLGNIRINQIISPSGNSDGPFGKDMTYDLNETGTWQIIVSESLMQGESFDTDFTVKLEIQ